MSIGFKQKSDGSWYSYKIIKNNQKPSIQEPFQDLSAMTIEQLKQYANEKNVELSGNASKSTIIAEIQKALDNRTV